MKRRRRQKYTPLMVMGALVACLIILAAIDSGGIDIKDIESGFSAILPGGGGEDDSPGGHQPGDPLPPTTWAPYSAFFVGDAKPWNVQAFIVINVTIQQDYSDGRWQNSYSFVDVNITVVNLDSPGLPGYDINDPNNIPNLPPLDQYDLYRYSRYGYDDLKLKFRVQLLPYWSGGEPLQVVPWCFVDDADIQEAEDRTLTVTTAISARQWDGDQWPHPIWITLDEKQTDGSWLWREKNYYFENVLVYY